MAGFFSQMGGAQAAHALTVFEAQSGCCRGESLRFQFLCGLPCQRRALYDVRHCCTNMRAICALRSTFFLWQIFTYVFFFFFFRNGGGEAGEKDTANLLEDGGVRSSVQTMFYPRRVQKPLVRLRFEHALQGTIVASPANRLTVVSKCLVFPSFPTEIFMAYALENFRSCCSRGTATNLLCVRCALSCTPPTPNVPDQEHRAQCASTRQT